MRAWKPSPSPSQTCQTNGLLEKAVLWMKQKAQLRNPEGKLMLMEAESAALLNVRASSYQGIKTGDDERVRRCFWELSAIGSGWRFFQSTVETTRMSGGLEGIIDWRDNGDGLARRQGLAAWGKNGVMVSQMSDMPVALYYGEPFDSNASPIVSKNPSDIPALWEYCASPGYRIEVRKVDQSLKPTNTSLVQVPFDLEHWQKEAAQRYPDGLPKPFSSDPTQWLFSGHPRGSDQPLHVAVARLLGYQWPRQTGSNHSDCAGLSADGLEKLADDDGIVPISSAKGEGPAAERLRELLARAYGKEWNAARQETLLAQADYSDASLDDWLRNGFFEQHCTLFNNRPFVWHVWDGLGEGFHALINYHSLASSGAKGRQTLEKLTFSYLGDWITRQKAEQKAGNEGADAKIAAALYLQDQLKLILEGEPPYDLFVRWKPLHEQAIGWQPDVNDGVRMNIRPFMMAKTLYGKSIFRKTPKIKWDKDRGKEPERPKKDFPWFWGWDEKSKDFMGGRAFDGNRWNDLHYSCDVKQDARTRQKEKKR